MHASEARLKTEQIKDQKILEHPLYKTCMNKIEEALSNDKYSTSFITHLNLNGEQENLDYVYCSEVLNYLKNELQYDVRFYIVEMDAHLIKVSQGLSQLIRDNFYKYDILPKVSVFEHIIKLLKCETFENLTVDEIKIEISWL
jgi:hypothetical protein